MSTEAGDVQVQSITMSDSISEISKINFVAWWGAIVSTIVLGWDVYKWASKGARVKVLTRCGVAYPDSRVVSVETTENGTKGTLATYCHIEVLNRGDAATTIVAIEGTHERKKDGPQVLCTSLLFIGHEGKRLPIVLAPGEMWSARIEMEHLESLVPHGRPFISVRSSHRAKPIRAYPKINA